MQRLEGQRILVTGSTRGIGRAIAARLLEEGATVGIHGRKQETASAVASELGERALPCAGDLADPAVAVSVVEEFAASQGGIDGLVNNAGGGEPGAFRGVTLESWRATFARNAEAAMLAAQAAYKIMRKQKAGSIVNVASLAAHVPGGWMSADYAASKAALVSLTKSLALEAARFGIRCNALSPGFVESDMTIEMPDSAREALRVPLGGLGKPEQIAAVAAFLLSSDAAYMTGQVLHVDGGLWMHG